VKSGAIKEADKLKQQALVNAALEGDQAAFQKLYGILEPLLRGSLASVSPEGYLDDLVQVTITKAFGRLAQFRGDSAFTSWCVSIGRNEAFTERRRLKREASVIVGSINDTLQRDDGVVTLNADALAYTDPAYRHAAAHGLVHGAIAQLKSKEQRTALLMRLEGASVVEIAAAVGQQSNNVKTLINRGKANVRRILKFKGRPDRD